MKKLQDISSYAKKYLLFDEALTAEKKGFALTMNPAIRTEEPVLTRNRPWEAKGIVGSFSVVEDEGLYKLWYTVEMPPPSKGRGSTPSFADIKGLDAKTRGDYLDRSIYVLCYATSEDGITWKKPNLGIFEYKGSKKNNMLFAMLSHGTVFKDPSSPPAKRYKMIFPGGPRMPHERPDTDIPVMDVYFRICGAYSSDGLNWKPYKKPIIPWYKDTTDYCYWDDRIKKYVAFVRWNGNMTYKDGVTILRGDGTIYRAIGRTESKDFRSFPTPVNVLEPSVKEREPDATGWDYYNACPIKYSYAADSYFLFPSVFYHQPDTRDIHLATSRDGVNYTHWPSPFVGLGQPDAYDSQTVYMGQGMIRRGHEIYMYYTGFDFLHGVAEHPDGFGKIGRVRIRLDGFVSQDARSSGGRLVTVPVKLGGNRLEVNMDGSAGGCLKVELLDKAGKPISGYSKRDADWLWGNDVQKTVTWNGQSDLSSIKGKNVRLSFIGEGVKLYAFEFTG